MAFLHHLEQHRANTVAVRNNRLAALHAFARNAAANYPEPFERCQQLLALPPKRARNGPSSISTGTRSERCCRHRTRQPRRAVGTVPCCWPCATRERVCRKSSTCALATRSWSVPAKGGCSGRGARSASARCSPRRRPPCEPCKQEQGLLPGEERPLLRNRYGQPLGRHGVCGTSSATMPARRRNRPRASRVAAFTLTPCSIALRVICCRAASTS